jgi:hypothetical protein
MDGFVDLGMVYDVFTGAPVHGEFPFSCVRQLKCLWGW